MCILKHPSGSQGTALFTKKSYPTATMQTGAAEDEDIFEQVATPTEVKSEFQKMFYSRIQNHLSF